MPELFRRWQEAYGDPPTFYLSTGAWDVAPALRPVPAAPRLPARPAAAHRLGARRTPAWFRSGREHKRRGAAPADGRAAAAHLGARRRRRAARPVPVRRGRGRAPRAGRGGRRSGGSARPSRSSPTASRCRCGRRPPTMRRWWRVGADGHELVLRLVDAGLLPPRALIADQPRTARATAATKASTSCGRRVEGAHPADLAGWPRPSRRTQNCSRTRSAAPRGRTREHRVGLHRSDDRRRPARPAPPRPAAAPSRWRAGRSAATGRPRTAPGAGRRRTASSRRAASGSCAGSAGPRPRRGRAPRRPRRPARRSWSRRRDTTSTPTSVVKARSGRSSVAAALAIRAPSRCTCMPRSCAAAATAAICSGGSRCRARWSGSR